MSNVDLNDLKGSDLEICRISRTHAQQNMMLLI